MRDGKNKNRGKEQKREENKRGREVSKETRKQGMNG